MALRRPWRMRSTATCLAALALVPLMACGSDEEQPRPASLRTTLAIALEAFADGDHAALCDTLSHRGKLLIGLAQHGSLPLDCPEDVRLYVGALSRYGNDWQPELQAVSRPEHGRAVATSGCRTACERRSGCAARPTAPGSWTGSSTPRSRGSRCARRPPNRCRA
jgi:hypothetical protein